RPARGARARRPADPGQLRRRRLVRPRGRGQRRGLDHDPVREPLRQLLHGPGRRPGHGRGRLRPDRQHRLPGRRDRPARARRVLGFTRVLAVEWARRGITINAVSPTIADTALAREIWVGEKGETAREEIPAGRFVTPEEIASLVAYLASEDAAMVTGENLRIDGGRSVI